MSGLWRIIKYGVVGFRRNIWLSIIAVITMTMTLMTVTLFAVTDIVAKKQYDDFNNKIDYSIFLRDSASDTDAAAFFAQLKQQSEVKEAIYLTKEDTRLRFQKDFSQIEELKDIITQDNNPLPRQIDVKFTDPMQIEIFNKFVIDPKYSQVVENTSYRTNKPQVDNYIRMTNIAKVFSLFFTVFFIIIAFLVILNTIRLAIFARREEIEIMRLVGATRSYIRGPFLVEGVLFGMLGSLITALLFYFLLSQLSVVLKDSLATGSTNVINDLFKGSMGGIVEQAGFRTFYSQLVVLQVCLGVVLGSVCSFIAARKYLRD